MRSCIAKRGEINCDSHFIFSKQGWYTVLAWNYQILISVLDHKGSKHMTFYSTETEKKYICPWGLWEQLTAAPQRPRGNVEVNSRWPRNPNRQNAVEIRDARRESQRFLWCNKMKSAMPVLVERNAFALFSLFLFHFSVRLFPPHGGLLFFLST